MPYATCNDVEIYYEIHGQGEPLVCLHGFSSTHTSWLLMLPKLSEHFQVIILDNRDAGLSAKVSTSYTTRDIATDVVELLDHLNIARAHILGQSMGGIIAQQMAIHFPQRVNHLILLTTTAKLNAYARCFVELELEAFRTQVDLGVLAKIICISIFTAATLAKPETTLLEENIAKTLRHVDADALARTAQACFGHNTHKELPNILAPTLLLAAEFDQIASHYEMQAMQRQIPGAKLVIIPKAGHAALLEQPQELTTEIINFIRTTYEF